MSQYSFPILSDREICQCLGELGMNVGTETLAKPTPELIQPIYEMLVTTLMGVSREELQQPVFSALDGLAHPELYDEAIPVVAFSQAVQRLLTASGIRDASPKDAHRPEAQRLRRNLSAVINFAKFREEKLAIYAELQEQVDELAARRDREVEREAALEGELTELAASEAVEAPEAQRLRAEADAVCKENAALNRRQAALGEELRAAKGRVAALASEAASLAERAADAQAAADALRERVVQSPQRVAAALAAVEGAVERERQALADAERQQRDVAARCEAANKAQRELGRLLDALKAAANEVAAKKGASAEVKEARAEVERLRREADAAEDAARSLRRQHAAVVERTERLAAQGRMRREAFDASAEKQRRDREALEAELAASAARAAQNEAAARKIAGELAELREGQEATRTKILDAFATLRRQIEAYHADLDHAMHGGGGVVPTSTLRIR